MTLTAAALEALPAGTVVRGVATVLGDSAHSAVIRDGDGWLVTGHAGPRMRHDLTAELVARWSGVQVLVPGAPVLGLTVGSAFAAAVADVRTFERSGCWVDSASYLPGPEGFAETWPGFADLLALFDGTEVLA